MKKTLLALASLFLLTACDDNGNVTRVRELRGGGIEVTVKEHIDGSKYVTHNLTANQRGTCDVGSRYPECRADR